MMIMFWLYYDGEALDINNNTSLTPEDFEIQSIYPNPFNPLTTIQFSLDLYSNVTLNLFDIRGKLVETLVDKLLQPGIHELQWNGQNYASGVYFAKLIQGGRVDVQKLMLIKWNFQVSVMSVRLDFLIMIQWYLRYRGFYAKDYYLTRQ